MAKTIQERDRLLELIEQAMLQGITRPTAIAKVVPGVTRQTAVKYAVQIEKRWATREGAEDREKMRRRLIEQAKHVMRRAWETYAHAVNQSNFNASTSALRRVLDAQERIAKLVGLDSESVQHTFDENMLDGFRSVAIAQAQAEVDNDALRTMRDAT